MLSIPDFGVPEDRSAFKALAGQVATWLQNGENVLIHCGAGIGRTGTLAIAALLFLGISIQEASEIVHSAGSQPETTGQKALLIWLSAEVVENRRNT
jgi:protein-tyrosine phosphatase